MLIKIKSINDKLPYFWQAARTAKAKAEGGQSSGTSRSLPAQHCQLAGPQVITTLKIPGLTEDEITALMKTEYSSLRWSTWDFFIMGSKSRGAPAFRSRQHLRAIQCSKIKKPRRVNTSSCNQNNKRGYPTSKGVSLFQTRSTYSSLVV